MRKIVINIFMNNKIEKVKYNNNEFDELINGRRKKMRNNVCRPRNWSKLSIYMDGWVDGSIAFENLNFLSKL